MRTPMVMYRLPNLYVYTFMCVQCTLVCVRACDVAGCHV